MNGIAAHIGTGCIYLHGFQNIDVWQSGAALAKDCPGGVDKWGTTEDAYYAKVAHIDAAYLGQETPDHEAIVCDKYGSWTNLPFDDDSVELLLSRQTFEHLSKTESRHALAEARRVLKVGGVLRLDVPDHEAALREHARLLKDAELESNVPLKIEKKRKAAFMLRHLLGSRKNDWAWHMGSWTRAKLIEFCGQYGFKYAADEPNIHFYPAFCLKFQKQPTCNFPELDEPIHPWKAAWEYCGEGGGPLVVPDDWICLEVGPGAAPWPRADLYYDIVPRDLPESKFEIADVQRLSEAGSLDNRRVHFSFVAHCLEHVEDPVKAASELSRVSKAGCVVSPHPMKEGLLDFHEADHLWHVIAGKDRLYFHRIPPTLHDAIYDAEVSGQAHRQYRYGDRRLEGLCNKMKRWWHSAEPFYDTIFHWKNELKVTVLE